MMHRMMIMSRLAHQWLFDVNYQTCICVVQPFIAATVLLYEVLVTVACRAFYHHLLSNIALKAY